MAGGILDRIRKAHTAKTDEQLRGEIEEGRTKLRSFRREHSVFRERAHQAVDASQKAAEAALERELARFGGAQGPLAATPQAGGTSILERLGALHAAASPELAKRWHAAVDAAEGFSPLTLAEFQAQEAGLAGEIRDRETELERRQVAARRAEADAELAALEGAAGAGSR